MPTEFTRCSNAYLGIGTRRQWSDWAIARPTPALLALYSLVTLITRDRLSTELLPVRTAAWYSKGQPTFSDTLAWVQRWLSRHNNYSIAPYRSVMVNIPRALFERLIDTVCYTA